MCQVNHGNRHVCEVNADRRRQHDRAHEHRQCRHVQRTGSDTPADEHRLHFRLWISLYFVLLNECVVGGGVCVTRHHPLRPTDQ